MRTMTLVCRLLTHQTFLWHHHLGHPSLPRLRGIHSRLLVSGLPRSLPPLPRSLVPPCLPCVEGRQRAAPHSSLFPPTTAPLQTLHMDVWGPARIAGHGGGHYFLLVVDDYTHYATVFPLQSKADVRIVLIRWIRAVRRQLSSRFWHDHPVLRLHSDREVGDASAFRVWGSLALVRDPPAGKLSPRTLRCVFLGFPNDAPPWCFYHRSSRRVLSSKDVTFYESAGSEGAKCPMGIGGAGGTGAGSASARVTGVGGAGGTGAGGARAGSTGARRQDTLLL
ncbi:unnamed protein product [Closterium sp. NIES-53]